MSDWYLVMPYAMRNLVRNPSAELAGSGYSAYGGATIVRDESYQAVGYTSYYFGATTGQGITLNLASTTSTSVTVQLYLKCSGTPSFAISLDGGATWPALTKRVDIDDEWSIWATGVSGVIPPSTITIKHTGSVYTQYWLDGIMVLEGSLIPDGRWATYLDGDQPGCVWEGRPHASGSWRPSTVRTGGLVYDLEEDLHFAVGGSTGVGAVPYVVSVSDRALLPGATVTAAKPGRREFSLHGAIVAQDWATFHGYRQALVEALAPQSSPLHDGRPQPVRLVYTGSSPIRYIDCYYQRGLEYAANAREDLYYTERDVALEFVAPEPVWYSWREHATYLVPYTFGQGGFVRRYISLSNAGVWDRAGIVPGGITGTGTVLAIAVGVDGKVYIGGDFTGVAGVANTSYIAAYDPVSNSWSAVGGGLNGVVRALAVRPNGVLYAGGDFVDAGGVAAADYIAKYDTLAGGSWSAVSGTTLNARVRALCFDAVTGNAMLFVGGDFTNVGGDADMDYCVYLDGTTWRKMDADELNGAVYAIAQAADGTVYIGGAFTAKVGNANVCRVCSWKYGGSFAALGRGLNGTVHAIACAPSTREVYFGGAFTATTAGLVAPRVAMWNGSNYVALGGGVTGGNVHSLMVTPDGVLWVGGAFTGVGDLSIPVRYLARWMGQTWCPVECLLPSGATVYALAAAPAATVSSRQYQLYVSTGTTSGTFTRPAMATVRTSSTAPTYPTLRAANSSAAVQYLRGVRIGSTGMEIVLDYALRNGESVEIVTDPAGAMVRSNRYDVRPSGILPVSDIGAFALLPYFPPGSPAASDLYAGCDDNGTGTPVGWNMRWRDAYLSMD